ncbi:leucine-rich repeat neuronal protein 2-like [Notolabrus celidotus]|uniref:leucine-rich repeat neuronal protein 2-like n=1 Tax=Notolabrus celidotus TaxID=1203425 RepID=UPI00148F80DF|nr:leucine-rich repeat neuronal protein 2-like [Notolabrus celidotus]XP_034538201.1 leucine-rich repeat neuronal protein 2-like [Notolabrus celidotus]XP_034538206.1 leucine-rich repeat neuronal protein 2-like [Notolabrus celidotus]XP_034538213.1 leucine-rich repeat neuronal protein 2-like [Notolabrus celidotus]XP_034538219.1 leucine-rich repeat neuronal protein 2-like [Notolabrus celidotus]
MRPTLILLQTQCLLCVFIGVCVPAVVVGSLPHALPWHVSCPVRCVCQIKPWFSPDSVYHEAPTVDCNDLLMTKLPLPIPPNTHTLRLQSNLLSEIDTAVLHRLPNLTDLDLSQNRFSRVRTITKSSPIPSLLSLHLEENHLSHLPEASFSSLPNLQELFLSHNNLHSISPKAFVGLDSLLRLHINNNRLITVDPQWFKALPNLEVLMLGGNPVEALPERGFQALKSLRSLVLGGMGLRGLAEKSLEGLEGLESLSFYDNKLTKVPTQALRRVPGLKFLDLNKNRIKLIETGDFRDMVHLKELGLNNMDELVSIERGALDNLPELTKLEITNNPRLSYIHPQAFLQLSRLESLMLNSNSLSALHQHIVLSLPSLQEVSLHSNPLRCDCLFHWAAEEASHPHTEVTQTPRMVRFIQPQATLCSEPPELRARRVREVSSREMSASCLPMIPSSSLPSYVGVREGGKLVLHCRALADPQPELYWVTPSGLKLGPVPIGASKSSPAPDPCHRITVSEGFNQTTASSVSTSHTQAQTHIRCSPSKHYRLLPEGTLEMNKVTLSEAGLYTCVAENVLGADTRSVTVGVHGREKKRKKGVAVNANVKGYQPVRVDPGLEVREVGQHYAILSWQNGHNLPSTRLSWQAIYSNAHTPTYTTRILAGTQSFNLTHLQAETFYRVCLHLGISEGDKHASRRSRESRTPQCVSFRTKDVPEPQPSLQISPELTSTAVTLLLLALILMLLAGQGWDTEPGEGAGKQHITILQEIKSPKALIINQTGSDENPTKQSHKCVLNLDC